MAPVSLFAPRFVYNAACACAVAVVSLCHVAVFPVLEAAVRLIAFAMHFATANEEAAAL